MVYIQFYFLSQSGNTKQSINGSFARSILTCHLKLDKASKCLININLNNLLQIDLRQIWSFVNTNLLFLVDFMHFSFSFMVAIDSLDLECYGDKTQTLDHYTLM